MKQDVLVLLRRAPYGRVHVPEGLRAARGVAAGFDRHDVTAAFVADGVHAARKSIDREALNMPGHVEDLVAEGGELVADGTALADRGIDESAVAEDVTVLSGEELTERIRAADHTLDF